MKISNIMRAIKHSVNKVSQVVLWGFVSLSSQLAYADPDPLAGVIESKITPTFGVGSTFFALMILAEILSSFWAYHKTKSLAVLASAIAVAVIFDILYSKYVG